MADAADQPPLKLRRSAEASAKAELAGLPSRVEALEHNVSEFRVEVRNEFAEVRAETRSESAAVRADIKFAIKESEQETGRQMFMVHEDLVQRIDASQEGLRRDMRELDEDTRREMRELNDETRRQMHVLHEDLVQRLRTIGEGRS